MLNLPPQLLRPMSSGERGCGSDTIKISAKPLFGSRTYEPDITIERWGSSPYDEALLCVYYTTDLHDRYFLLPYFLDHGRSEFTHVLGVILKLTSGYEDDDDGVKKFSAPNVSVCCNSRYARTSTQYLQFTHQNRFVFKCLMM